MASFLKPLGPGKDDWRAINRLAARLEYNRNETIAARHNLDPLLRGRELGRGNWHPFRIYQVYSTPAAPQNDWLRYRVRAGRVMETDATGTDGKDADPDEEELQAAGDSDIIIETGQAKFWFWLEIGSSAGATTATVRYGPDPTASSYGAQWTSTDPWTGAPVPDAGHIPIGWVDTHTQEADKIAIVRQLLRADVIFVAGEGGAEFEECHITTLFGSSTGVDYIGVKRWTGAALVGDEFKVAKSVPSRMPGSKTIYGTAFTYTYTDDNNRVSDDGSTAEDQVMLEPFVVGDTVFVAECDHTGVTVSGVVLTKIEVNTEREWCKKSA